MQLPWLRFATWSHSAVLSAGMLERGKEPAPSLREKNSLRRKNIHTRVMYTAINVWLFSYKSAKSQSFSAGRPLATLSTYCTAQGNGTACTIAWFAWPLVNVS